MKPTTAVEELRKLKFESLDDVIGDVERLRDHGYSAAGNWSLAQMCQHLRIAQDASMDGYPKWLSFFAPLRPLVRWWLLPRALSSDPPRGIKTLPLFEPDDAANDAVEVDKFVASCRRFESHQGKLFAHPGFGRMDKVGWEALHVAHAAHHLRHLQPTE